MIDLFDQLAHFSLGVDLGTSNTRIIAQNKGLVVKEPSVVARQKKKGGQVLAIGKKAKQMVGKEPRQMEVIEPIGGGVIADFDATIKMVEHFLSLVRQTPGKLFKIFGPKVIVGVSSGATEVEKRAVKAVMVKTGAREVFLVEKPMAAAIGMGLPVAQSAGLLILDLGGGTTEIAVISLGGIVLNRCLALGGKQMDEAILNYLRLKYGILVGRTTGEKIKIELGRVYRSESKSKKQMVVRGRDLENGLPKSIRITEEEVMEALVPIIQRILTQLSELLEEMPVELTNDILKRGIGLTGGASQLKGLDRLVGEETKMPVWRAEAPLLSVVQGSARLLEDNKLLDRVKLVSGLR